VVVEETEEIIVEEEIEEEVDEEDEEENARKHNRTAESTLNKTSSSQAYAPPAQPRLAFAAPSVGGTLTVPTPSPLNYSQVKEFSGLGHSSTTPILPFSDSGTFKPNTTTLV
jgi:hypothetical protein